MSKLSQLDSAVKAVCPIDGLSLSGSDVSIQFLPIATRAQREAARTVVDNFDWSSESNFDKAISYLRNTRVPNPELESDPKLRLIFSHIKALKIIVGIITTGE